MKKFLALTLSIVLIASYTVMGAYGVYSMSDTLNRRAIEVSASADRPKKSADGRRIIYLTHRNVVNLRGGVDWSSVASWSVKLARLAILRVGNAPIYIAIDSGGGGIRAGMSFIRFAKQFSNVHTITLSGASMAAGIAMGVPGKRLVVEGGVFMFHRATASISGQVEKGELESRLKSVQRLVLSMEKLNAKRMGISIKKYKKKVVSEWWLEAEEAVAANVADEIVDVKCSAKLLSETTKVSMRTPFGTRNLKFSNCPLIQSTVK